MSLEQLSFDVGDAVGVHRLRQAGGRPRQRSETPASLTSLAWDAERATSGVARARALLDLASAVQHALADSMKDAYCERRSWRLLSADLQIPFQTLHRRYGPSITPPSS